MAILASVPSAANPSEKVSPALPRRPLSVMLSVDTARRILRRRTGVGISRTTFYRWISSGKIYSIRLGTLIRIPQFSLDDLIERCLRGERF